MIACLFSGCTCAGNPPPVPTPTATVRPPDTAPPAPRHTDTPPPVAATAAPPVAVSPTADSNRLAACQGYVAVLSGRTKDSAMLDSADVRALADANLVMCGAVFSDSDMMCQKLMPEERGPSTECLRTQSIFHELRTYPGTRAFLFDDVDEKECTNIPGLATFCTSLRKVLRSKNAESCSQLGDAESVCRAYMAMDKSRCHVTGKLATLEVEVPGERKPGESKGRVKDWIEETCRRSIEERASFADGLKALAQSGPPHQRELARAALKQDDACQTYAQAAMQSCAPGGTAASTPATAGNPPSGTAAPTAPGAGPG